VVNACCKGWVKVVQASIREMIVLE